MDGWKKDRRINGWRVGRMEGGTHITKQMNTFGIQYVERDRQITLNMSSKNVRRGAVLTPWASSPAEAEDAEFDDA
jgi:hypothetical protein